MHAPITVNYTPDGDDWTVTVAVAGETKTQSAKAVGLIAARDRADQMVAKIEPNDDQRRVVHLLDGDAYAFTTSYLHARLGLVHPAGLIDPVGRVQPAKISTDQVINGVTPPWPDATAEGVENA
ncbi:MAG TPA: hypothetical protein VH333_17165 [Pseudonocardiaceae bacterium]|jgi:hypothetical protein|nr:hypothetical protein [Pseudonocardiaceae bacterium]